MKEYLGIEDSKYELITHILSLIHFEKITFLNVNDKDYIMNTAGEILIKMIAELNKNITI